MLGIMLALGAYRFSLSTAAYQSLERQAQWRWPAQELIRAHPVRQWVGPGDQTIKLEGVVLPHYKGMLSAPNLLSRLPELMEIVGTVAELQSILQRANLDLPLLGDRPGRWQLDALRIDADKGLPMLMVDGRGRDWGYWVVDSLQERESHHMSHGAALKVEFNLELSYYGEEHPDALSGGTGLIDIIRGILGI